MYVVVESDGIEKIFEPLATKLLQKQASYPRTLTYCSSFADCSNVYSFFKTYIQKNTAGTTGVPKDPLVHIESMSSISNDSAALFLFPFPIFKAFYELLSTFLERMKNECQG